VAPHVTGHLFRQTVPAVVHRQHHALYLQAGIEAAAHQVDGPHQLGQSLQGEELALQRHQNRVRCGHGIDRQQVQRRRTVDQHIGVVARLPHRLQGVAQLERAARLVPELQLDAGQVRVGRHQVEPREVGLDHRRAHRLLAHQHVVEGGLALGATDAEARGGVALRIGVHQQHLFADGGEGGAEIDRRGGLADAALLVGDDQHPHWTVRLFGHDPAS
jgi:hypothetical protein